MKISGFGLIPNPWIFYFSGSFDENINHKILYQITLNFYQINILLKKKKNISKDNNKKKNFSWSWKLSNIDIFGDFGYSSSLVYPSKMRRW